MVHRFMRYLYLIFPRSLKMSSKESAGFKTVIVSEDCIENIKIEPCVDAENSGQNDESNENVTVLGLYDILDSTDLKTDLAPKNEAETSTVNDIIKNCSADNEKATIDISINSKELSSAKTTTNAVKDNNALYVMKKDGAKPWSEKYKEPFGGKSIEYLVADSPVESMCHADRTYEIGDFVYAKPPNSSIAAVVIRIQRLWINSRGEKMMWCNRFLRPWEIRPNKDQRCMDKEIFKSNEYSPIPISNIVGSCTVVDPKYYLEHITTFNKEDTYICVSKYSTKTKDFSMIHPIDYNKSKDYGMRVMILKGTVDSSSSDVKANSSDRPMLICQICLKSFKIKYDLAAHIKRNGHYIHNKISPFLKTRLPREPRFFVCYFKKTKSSYFSKICLPDLVNVDHLHDWLNCFMRLNNSIYIRRRSTSSFTSLYATTYRCQHFRPVSKSKRKTKGTNCRSTIYAAIKSEPASGTTVIIKFEHNHSLTSKKMLRYREPTDRVIDAFVKFCKNDLQPADALRCFKNHLRLQLSAADYARALSDRSAVPDYNWVNYFFKKALKPWRRSVTELEYMRDLIDSQELQTCAFIELQTNEFAVAIVTPLMRRISRTHVAGEIVFLDTIGSAAINGAKVYMLMTKLNVGEMPVGVLVTTSESNYALKATFKCFAELIDDTCFGNRGRNGPMAVLRSNSDAEAVAFKHAFPTTHHYFSHVHVLRTIYRWLHCLDITIEERMTLYTNIKKMVYAQSKDELEARFSSLLQGYVDHLKINSYLNRFYAKRSRWALCHRLDVLVRSWNANNFVERMLTERFVDRLRTRSVVELVKFILNEFDKHYGQKLLNACDGDVKNEVDFGDLISVNRNLYTVSSYNIDTSFFLVENTETNSKYLVNMDIGMCSCYHGWNGSFCKHQQILATQAESTVPFQTSTSKEYLHYLATGESSHCSPTDEFITNEVIVDNNVQEEIAEEITDTTYNEDVARNEISLLAENLNDLVFILSENPHYYYAGVTAMNNELEKLKTPAARLCALYSLKKNGRRKTNTYRQNQDGKS